MRNVYLIATSFFFIFFGFGTAQQYLVVLLSSEGRDALALVALLCLYGAFLVTGVLVAKLIPLFGGLKRSLILGALSYVLLVASVALDNAPILLTTSLFAGVGAGLLWISSGQILADSSNQRTVGRNLSFQQVGMYCGNILGIWVGGFLADSLDLHNMYALLAIAVFIGVLTLTFVRPIKEEVNEQPTRAQYLLTPAMLSLLPLVFGAYYLQAQVFTAVNLMVVGILGIGFIPLVITIIKVSNVVGSFGSGTIAGWYEKSVILSALVLLALLGIAIFTLFSTLTSLLFGALLLGFSMAAIYPVTLAWLKEKLSEDEYIYALGTFHVYTNVAMAAAIMANIALPAYLSFIPGVVALMLALPGIYSFHAMSRKHASL